MDNGLIHSRKQEHTERAEGNTYSNNFDDKLHRMHKNRTETNVILM